MEAKDDVELFFSDYEDSDSFELELEDDINPEIETHVLLFRNNKFLELQELLKNKLNQQNWAQLCDAVVDHVNLETFLLLPQFLHTPSGMIHFNETCSMPVMDYLSSNLGKLYFL